MPLFFLLIILIVPFEHLFSVLQDLKIKMIGSFPARLLLMVFGYLYPAFECFKLVEKQDLEMDQLKYICQYWILVALFTTCERLGDSIVSWLPLFNELKVALILYLWHPRTRGTMHIYGSFVRPYLVNHEKKIDLFVMDLSKRIGAITNLLWQKVLISCQRSFFEAIQSLSSKLI